jgi:5'-3' exonuclease
MTIIFDGNYLFYKSLFVFSSYGNSGKLLEEKGDQEMFIRKIATDMSYSIRQFGNPDHIIFTIDSKSWRKELVDETYKANRSKDESSVNWNNFFDLMNEFSRILLSKGFVVSRQEKAEGDDLMALWSKHLLQNGMDSIIVTGDKDLTQSVDINSSGNFVVVYNSNSKTRKLYVKKGFSTWVSSEEADIFNVDSYMNRGKDLIREAMNAVDIEEIDPFYVVFEKVIMGDSGDGVAPIYTWKKGEKNFRITPAKCERIWEILNSVKPVTDILELPNRFAEIHSAIGAIYGHQPAADAVRYNLEQNIKLVYLDHRVIPQSIQEEFAPHFESLLRRKKLAARSYDMHTLLENTRFVNSGRTFESDIFKAFDK